MIRLLLTVSLVCVGFTVFAATSEPAGDCKLLYSPMPPYPVLVGRAFFPVQGEGTFSVSFDFAGRVSGVKVIRSTGNDSLNDAAVRTLRHWTSEPGRECSVMVPVTFHQDAKRDY